MTRSITAEVHVGFCGGQPDQHIAGCRLHSLAQPRAALINQVCEAEVGGLITGKLSGSLELAKNHIFAKG